MGTIFRRNNKWYINYVDPNGKQVRRLVSEYKETAERVLKKVETDIIEGRYFDKKKCEPILFDDFIQEFVENYVKLENRHPKAQMGRIEVIQDQFKGKFLHEVDSRMIRKFLAQKLEALKPATVNRYFSMIKCIFNRAIDWKMFDGDNPTNGIKKLAEGNEKSCFLTEEQQQNLLSHCHGITKMIVLTALQTGMRWNEMMKLKWCDLDQSNYVDFDNNVIVIHSANSKSKKSRFIPMSYVLQCQLFDLKKTSTSEYVFVNPQTGKPFNNIRRSFLRAVKEAGLKDMSIHSLRHAFASNLVRTGVSLYVVQRLLGHSSLKMTQRYAHIQDDHLETAIEGINLNLCQK